MKFCHNHPTVQARRRCFECRRPLCPACQRRLSRHIFCSEDCHRRHLRQTRARKLQQLRHRPVKNPWLRWAVYTAAGSLGVVLLLASRQLPDLVTAVDPLPGAGTIGSRRPLATIDWSAPGAVTMEIVGAPTAGQVAAEGAAPTHSIVGLYVNEVLSDVLLCQGGAYRFDEVTLRGGANLLQVRYFDQWGDSAYSRAAVLHYSGRAPAPRLAPVPEAVPGLFDTRNITRGVTHRPEILLSFDAGASSNAAASILGTLRERGIRSVIFVTGLFIERFPEVVRRIVADGHEVANHTYDHPHLTTFSFNYRHDTLKGVTREFLQDQLRRTAEAFTRLTGRELLPYWRAPFGEQNAAIRAWAAELGYAHLGWTPVLDTLDWLTDRTHRSYRTPEETKRRIIDRAGAGGAGLNGGIVLMHLGTERAGPERIDRILPEVIDALEDRGYRFVTATELVARLEERI